MNTAEDFKNAPVGSTATRKVTGHRAMKMDEVDWYWMSQKGIYLTDVEMEGRGYTLDPIYPNEKETEE